MKVIIVGGVAGGATAAARIRRLNEHAEITVLDVYKRQMSVRESGCVSAHVPESEVRSVHWNHFPVK